jgi:hypothetical protein
VPVVVVVMTASVASGSGMGKGGGVCGCDSLVGGKAGGGSFGG